MTKVEIIHEWSIFDVKAIVARKWAMTNNFPVPDDRPSDLEIAFIAGIIEAAAKIRNGEW